MGDKMAQRKFPQSDNAIGCKSAVQMLKFIHLPSEVTPVDWVVELFLLGENLHDSRILKNHYLYRY